MDTTVLSKAKQDLIAEAMANGYTLTTEESFLDLEKPDTQGLRIYSDGHGFSLSVMRESLSAARCMRSVKEMRSILELPT